MGDLTEEESLLFFNHVGRVSMGLGAIDYRLHHQQGFLISSSFDCSSVLRTRFDSEPFMIVDVEKFVDVFSRAISRHRRVIWTAHCPVNYVLDKMQYVTSLQELRRRGSSIKSVDVADYFVKPADDYKIENEYRFIFSVEHIPDHNDLDLCIPHDEIASCCSFDVATS